MFVKRLIQKASNELSLRTGNLKSSRIELKLTVHHGIPASASVLAFDPVQHLLAIASRDGRIKIFGRDGVEAFLQSPTHAPCKYLEFVHNEGRLLHVTTQNLIEVWDLKSTQLVHFCKWNTDITAFAVIQGTSFMYIGDETGLVSVLHFDNGKHALLQMPYSIPVHVTLFGLINSGDVGAPSVVSILPQPDAVHDRVVFVYANGVIVLWALHESQVLTIRGGTDNQQKKLFANSEDEEIDEFEDEKEACCACWASSNGQILAVGYTDGDIWLWNLPVTSSDDATFLSNSPLLKLQLSSEDLRMPVVVIRWSPGVRAENGKGGLLYVFGGQTMGAPEGVTILSLSSSDDDTSAVRLELPLHGPFADVATVSMAGADAAVLLLTSPGVLHVYEETNILNSLTSNDKSSVPEPITFRFPLLQTSVRASKLVVCAEDGAVANKLLKLPRVLWGYIPANLPSGTRWPVTGGILAPHSPDKNGQPFLYISGHKDGSVNIWDASSFCLYFVASIGHQGILGSESAVTAVDFCATTGLLAVGNEGGLVCLYILNAEPKETTVHIISTSEPTAKRTVQSPAGLQCFAILKVHQATIKSIAIASDATCVAVGDDSGLVSLFDLDLCKLRFYGKRATGGLVSFYVATLPGDEVTTVSSTPQSLVFVLSSNSTVTAIDGISGNEVGRGQPKSPSNAISIHLLDASGNLVSRVTQTPKASNQEAIAAVVSTDESGETILPTVGNEELRGDSAADGTDSDNLFLLCCEDSLRLYTLSSVLQGMRTTVRKIKLDKVCCYASTFKGKGGCGIILLYKSGQIELRSLPDLGLLKEVLVNECLSWGLSQGFYNTLTSSSNGLLAAVDDDREIIFMSLLGNEQDVRLSSSALPLLYDKDVATATEAAIKASTHTAKRKQSQIQDLFGGVMKEIKQSLGNPGGVVAVSGLHRHSPEELLRLFATSPHFSAALPSLSSSPNVSNSSISANEVMRMSSPSEEKGATLDIDDIDLDDDDDDFSSPSPSSAPRRRRSSIVKKLTSSFKGKKKASGRSNNEEDARSMLFEGGSSASKEKMPVMRTADEIKAAYGHHKKSGEASSAAAAQARDKLMERQEKLQAINRRTEEMQHGAENFANMAEELAKKMESRKWWEI